jgi:putative phosphoribosyl transferase
MQAMLFKNRIDAGQRLAGALSGLKRYHSKERRPESVIIVAIPRGGVIVGDVIASKLEAKLDIVVSRKIGAPDNPELAIGAVMPDRSYFLNEDVMGALHVSTDYIKLQVNTQSKEIYRRLMNYRGSTEYDNEFEGKTVVLVDDGIATGATILGSAQWIKSKHHCKDLVIASPLAPAETMDDLNQVADEVLVLHTPDPFIAIGRFYGDFDQVSDDQVKEIMKKYGYKVG